MFRGNERMFCQADLDAGVGLGDFSERYEWISADMPDDAEFAAAVKSAWGIE